MPVGGIVPVFRRHRAERLRRAAGPELLVGAIPIASAVLGTTYGNPGGGNFTMPDLRGRFFFNLDTGGSGRITTGGGNFDGTVLGNTGGTQSRNISQAMLPAVNFPVSGIALTNGTPSAISSNTAPAASGGVATALATVGVTVPNLDLKGNTNFSVTTNVTVAAQGSAASGGSGNQFAFIPPAMGINCMMRIA